MKEKNKKTILKIVVIIVILLFLGLFLAAASGVLNAQLALLKIP